MHAWGDVEIDALITTHDAFSRSSFHLFSGRPLLDAGVQFSKSSKVKRLALQTPYDLGLTVKRVYEL